MQVGEWITAECIDTRMGLINTKGGNKPVFIVELICDSFAMPIIKYFNCHHKGKNYTVQHDSDFAKTWRLTKGTNPKNQYSKAQQLLNQLPGHKFLVKGAPTSGKTTYFKATEIKPLKPVYSELWTPSGVLKKCPKKVTFQPLKIGNELATKKRYRPLKHLVLSLFSIPLQAAYQASETTYPLSHYLKPCYKSLDFINIHDKKMNQTTTTINESLISPGKKWTGNS